MNIEALRNDANHFSIIIGPFHHVIDSKFLLFSSDDLSIVMSLACRSMETEDTPPVSSAGPLTEEQVDEVTEEDSLVKESCHDSGIDIRDTSIPPVVPVQTNKKVNNFMETKVKIVL